MWWEIQYRQTIWAHDIEQCISTLFAAKYCQLLGECGTAAKRNKIKFIFWNQDFYTRKYCFAKTLVIYLYQVYFDEFQLLFIFMKNKYFILMFFGSGGNAHSIYIEWKKY